MASISVTGITQNSATVTVTADSSASRIWTLYLDGGVYEQTDKLSSKRSHTFYVVGLYPGTDYEVEGRYGPETGTEYPGTASSTTKEFRTLAGELEANNNVVLSCDAASYNSLKISVSGIGSINGITRTHYWYLDGKQEGYTTGVSGTTTTSQYEFEDLKANTAYDVTFKYKRTGSEYNTYYKTKTFTTLSLPKPAVTPYWNAIDISITGMNENANTRYWRFEIYDSTGKTLVKTVDRTQSESSTSYGTEITGLSSSTSYKLATSYGANTNYANSLPTVDFTTAVYPARNVTAYWNYIAISVAGMKPPTSTRYWRFKLYKKSNDALVATVTTTSDAGDGTGFAEFEKNITSNTEYYITIEYGPDEHYDYSLTTVSFATPGKPVCNVDAMAKSAKLTITGMSPPDKTRYWSFTTYKKGSSTAVCTVEAENAVGETSISVVIEGLAEKTEYYTVIKYGSSKTNLKFSIDDAEYQTDSVDYFIYISTSATHNSVTITATLNKAIKRNIDIVFKLKKHSAAVYRDYTKTLVAGETSVSCKFTTDIEPATVYYCCFYNTHASEEVPSSTPGYLKRRTKNNFSWSDPSWNMNVVSGKKFYINYKAWNEYNSQLQSKAQFYDVEYKPSTVSAGTKLTAARYNSIATIINQMVANQCGDCKTTVRTVSTGDEVTAYCINILADCLNE